MSRPWPWTGKGQRRRSGAGWLAGTVLATLLAPQAVVAQRTMLVHLPDAPMEESNQLAEAVTALGQLLNEAVAGLDLEVKLFRRWQDAHAYLEDNLASVSVVLCDAPFLLDLPPGASFEPSHRFRSSGETLRRVVVVKASRQELQDLGDLEGRTLSVVETTGPSLLAFVERGVFQGEVQVGQWFGALTRTEDDFTAVANVLYDQTDAALVSEENPLLASHLGRDLRSVFHSPPLSRPVLALARGALTPGQRQAWSATLDRIQDQPGGGAILTALKLDGLAPVPAGDAPLERAGLLELPPLPRKAMEVAAPRLATLRLTLPQLPGAEELLFSLTLELPEPPPVVDLLRRQATRPGR